MNVGTKYATRALKVRNLINPMISKRLCEIIQRLVSSIHETKKKLM
jgi:hypothetical protein